MNKTIGSIGLKFAYSYLDSNPEKNIPKLMDWVDRLAKKNAMEGQRKAIRKVIEEKDSNWYKLIMSMWTDIDSGVRRAFFENFILNENFIGGPIQEAEREKHDCNIPWAILMDPTSACNLKCTGCWAADYGNRLSMSYEELDGIIEQGKKMGVYFYLYSGGEPSSARKILSAFARNTTTVYSVPLQMVH